MKIFTSPTLCLSVRIINIEQHACIFQMHLKRWSQCKTSYRVGAPYEALHDKVVITGKYLKR